MGLPAEMDGAAGGYHVAGCYAAQMIGIDFQTYAAILFMIYYQCAGYAAYGFG